VKKLKAIVIGLALTLVGLGSVALIGFGHDAKEAVKDAAAQVEQVVRPPAQSAVDALAAFVAKHLVSDPEAVQSAVAMFQKDTGCQVLGGVRVFAGAHQVKVAIAVLTAEAKERGYDPIAFYHEHQDGIDGVVLAFIGIDCPDA